MSFSLKFGLSDDNKKPNKNVFKRPAILQGAFIALANWKEWRIFNIFYKNMLIFNFYCAILELYLIKYKNFLNF